MVDESVISKPLDYADNEISRYQTCYQISEVLTVLINGLVPTCHAKVIERKINGRSFNKEHVATEVIFKDNLKILLAPSEPFPRVQVTKMSINVNSKPRPCSYC